MKRKLASFFVIFGVVLLVSSGCGKKGPPFIPQKAFSLKVDKLRSELKDSFVVLKGQIVSPPGKRNDISDVTGCRVYHSWYAPEDPPCEGCPIDYPGYQEIKGEMHSGEIFSCELSLKKRNGIHFFKVHLIGQKGVVGPPSNRAKLILE